MKGGTMKYIECLNELQEVLNTSKRKGRIERFNKVIDDFNDIGFQISTKFIRNLINQGDERKKTQKIYNLIKQSKFTIERIVKDFKAWIGYSWNTQIKDYSYKKGYKLTEYDRINQFNSSRVDEIKMDLSVERVGNSYIALKKEVYYFLV